MCIENSMEYDKKASHKTASLQVSTEDLVEKVCCYITDHTVLVPKQILDNDGNVKDEYRNRNIVAITTKNNEAVVNKAYISPYGGIYCTSEHWRMATED